MADRRRGWGARAALLALVAAGGAAALGWEVSWQHHAALALGVSAQGAAMVLASTMAGMAAGALAARRWAPARPLWAYAALEAFVGAWGLALPALFGLLARWDAEGSPAALLVGIPAALIPPAAAMGATVPVFGRVGARLGAPLSAVYAANTLGAALGALGFALVAVPAWGVRGAGAALACVDFGVAAAAVAAGWAGGARPARIRGAPPEAWALGLAALTGAATFALEVAWFRTLRAAFLSTTATFAILLAAVLVAVAIGAGLGPWTRRVALGPWLAAAGAAVLVATPIVERMDTISRAWLLSVHASWLVQTLVAIGPPVILLSAVLPRLLDRAGPGGWGALYAANAAGAVAGALGAAWVVLPGVGATAAAWGVGAAIGAVGVAGSVRRIGPAVGVLAAFGVAVGATTGLGRVRVAGAPPGAEVRVVAHRETPDHTVSVVDAGGARRLVLDGFEATAEREAAAYMAWMGRLPMALHPGTPGPLGPGPRRALVICFGTGQTANAVRRAGGPDLQVDVVELSAAVLALAPWFPSNEGVLDDPRVQAHVLDGRAWLRRTPPASYDVITLEPMPPTFAGVNALYSREFTALLASRLRPGGVLAQWLPFHLVDPYRAASIVATVADVVPDAALWVDPASGTGVVLAAVPGGAPLRTRWPAARRPEVALDADGVARMAAAGDVITDDNQLLAVGADPRDLTDASTTAARNAALVELARRGAAIGSLAPHAPTFGGAVALVGLGGVGIAALAAASARVRRRSSRTRPSRGRSRPGRAPPPR